MGKHALPYAQAYIRAMNNDVSRPYDKDAYEDLAWLCDVVYDEHGTTDIVDVRTGTQIGA